MGARGAEQPQDAGVLGVIAPEQWCEVPAGGVGDAFVAALAVGGVEVLFFTSGSEICFYQEAIAKARALGRTAPKLITVTHEHANLNAALGYAAVSGKPAATAVHVDAGTLHHGGAIHTAMHATLAVVITAGFPPTTYAGTSPAARNAGGHLWLQETFDQHSIVRQYVKWDRRLNQHDNAGMIVSRALQVARSEPCGPVYLSVPPEVSMQQLPATRFASADHLGIPRPPAPDPKAACEIAERLVRARSPRVVVSGSGRNPSAVAALVELCELLALPVVHSKARCYLSYPMDHPLMLVDADLSAADVVLVLEADVPWIPGPTAPGDRAWIAAVGLDPIRQKFPTYEFTADLRVTADPRLAMQAIADAARNCIGPEDTQRIAERARATAEATRARREALLVEARAKAEERLIHPLWLGYQLGRLVGENSIVFDDTLPHNRLHEFLTCRRPGSYFYTPGTSGGWAPGAAFGGKLAAPERDVMAVTGDGFYMFATASAALWSAAHHGAPFLTVVYQNRSYGTGTLRTRQFYPGGHAETSGFDGGYFDPPMDFAKEAEACGAYGENVREPRELESALQRGFSETRKGRPAVVSVWLARHLHAD